MTEKKHRIILTAFAHRLLVKALYKFRNQLLKQKKPTEDINDFILKVIDTPKATPHKCHNSHYTIGAE